MGWQPSFRDEGRIYANYIQAFYPGKKIVALWQNDNFGRELFKGLEQGLGDVARMIRVDIAYDVCGSASGHACIDPEASRAPRFLCLQGCRQTQRKSIRIAAELDWHPVFILNQMASSIATALKPAGPENAAGAITAAFLKDANDPAWKDEQASEGLARVHGEIQKAGGKDDGAAMYRLCGRRDPGPGAQTMRQRSVSRKRHEAGRGARKLPALHAAARDQDQHRPWNFRPIKQLRLVQFDGRTWQPIGDVLETAFSNVQK